MKNVALHNLGCKVNAYEMDVMQQMLQEKGYKIVAFDEEADIYIINTCTVTNIADRKSRQMLHRAKAKNPRAVVVAVGCYVQTGKEDVEKDPAIDLAIGNNKKNEIVPILEAYLKEREESLELPNKTLHETSVIDINQPCDYEEMTLTETGNHTRAYIKIQDGCNQFCSYCIIPFARGRVRSRHPEDVLKEVRGLAESGCREVVLTGIHISSYGVDLESGISLIDLIEQIHMINGILRIRLGSLEPRIVTEDFAQKISRLPKICPHFHLSLQSGCDATLKRMNRRYNTSEYFECVKLLRKYLSNPAITTDVIVGFPGETVAEFEMTKEFLGTVRFYEMHIFRYSKRHKTVAATMPDQVADQIKAERSNELSEMERVQSGQYREQFVGETVEVLFEEEKEIQGETYQIGHTPHYVKVAKKTKEDLSNKILCGTVTGFLNPEMLLLK